MEITVFDVLIYMALGLMVLVTGGVLYLTAADWRDRRRQQREKRSR